MKRKLLLYLLFVTNIAFAQKAIQGVVVEQSSGRALKNASVVLLDADSIMRSFTRASASGAFSFAKVDSGSYTLVVSYPRFETFSKKVSLKAQDLKLDSIKIESQANLIEEIVINQRIPIKIKGDTIEYDAASFETEKNAKLEDLFRRLPGMSVSASGEIKAQGKTVKKVLIDGEEFFGYDPKIAIRNVRADAVDKVQVYERRSDKSEFTGIDDGVREQTVNVILKEEARSGLFGNANANWGSKGLYDANLFAAKFNRSERIGLTGNWNNMGTGGEGSFIRSNNQITGKPESKSAGINYDNNFLQRKLQLNSSYDFRNNSNENESKSYRKQIIDESKTQETNSESASWSDNKNNGLRASMRFKIDSASNMELKADAGIGRSQSASSSASETTRETNSRANDFKSSSLSESDNDRMNLGLGYMRFLNRKERSINIHVNGQRSSSEASSKVEELTNFYDLNGDLERTKAVNQLRLNSDENSSYGASLNFSEPLSKQLHLTVGYGFNSTERKGTVNAYNDESNQLSNTIDSLYSKKENDINRNNDLDFSIGYHSEKIRLNLSNKIGYVQQELSDAYRDISLERAFWQNNLNSMLSYQMSKSKSINLGYRNGTTVPSFSQLQPLQPPTNELYEQVGNPDLKRATNNTFSLGYMKYSFLKSSSLMINSNVSITSNAIVNKSIINEGGKTTTTYVNIADHQNWNASLTGSYDRPYFNGSVQIGPTASLSYNDGYQYINGDLNKNNSTNANIGINANKQNSRVADFNFSVDFGLANERNSVQQQLNNTNFRSSINTDIRYFLPFKFNLTQVIHYSYSGKTKVFAEPIRQFYMNLELSKKLLANESLQLNVKAFDIFNSFNNTNRSYSNNSFSQSEQQVLTQYFLAGLKWDFNKNLGKKND